MKRTYAAAAAACLLAGCATIFNGATQAVSIQSVPDGADITVVNSAGEKIHAGATPVLLTLKRGAGYFRPESYTITFTKAGFPTREMVVTGSLSGWYFGNIAFGGAIGMLAVDPVTGAMFTLPDTVTGTLAPEPAKSSGMGTLRVVSTVALSAEQMKHAQLLGAMP